MLCVARRRVFAHMCIYIYVCVQGASGLGAEDAQMVVEAMAQTGNEATYCMGDDIPLAVLSDKPHPLYNYFKQRFAQVREWVWVWVCTMLVYVHYGCG